VLDGDAIPVPAKRHDRAVHTEAASEE